MNEDIVYSYEMVNRRFSANTDGIIVKIEKESQIKEIKDICHEWENRTRMHLGYTDITRIYQRDVNNYLAVTKNGGVKSKGADVKELSPLDYNLAIVNKAVKEYMVNNTLPEITIGNNDNLIDYQMIVTVKGEYKYAVHEENGEYKRLNGKTHRVFASTHKGDGIISRSKVDKIEQMSLFSESVDKGHKFAGTPDNCFIVNSDVVNAKCSDYPLDKSWYIEESYRRLDMWGVLSVS